MKRRSLRSTGGSAARSGMPATSLRKPASANSFTRSMPLRPWRSAATTSSMVLPMQETMPRPVTTTRLDMLRYYVVQSTNKREDSIAELRRALILRALILIDDGLICAAALAADAVPIVNHDNVPVVTGTGKPASVQA